MPHDMTAVATLHVQPGEDHLILRGGMLVQPLIPRKLVDGYVLLIHALVLGSGRRLFPDGSPRGAFQLVDTQTATTGMVIAAYRLAEPPAGKIVQRHGGHDQYTLC